MSLVPTVTEATLHMPNGDLNPSTPHDTHNILPHTIIHNTMPTSATSPTTHASPTLINLVHVSPSDHTFMPSSNTHPDPTPTPCTTHEHPPSYGYTTLPLPALALTDI